MTDQSKCFCLPDYKRKINEKTQSSRSLIAILIESDWLDVHQMAKLSAQRLGTRLYHFSHVLLGQILFTHLQQPRPSHNRCRRSLSSPKEEKVNRKPVGSTMILKKLFSSYPHTEGSCYSQTLLHISNAFQRNSTVGIQ